MQKSVYLSNELYSIIIKNGTSIFLINICISVVNLCAGKTKALKSLKFEINSFLGWLVQSFKNYFLYKNI
jgi:hypothetical protein